MFAQASRYQMRPTSRNTPTGSAAGVSVPMQIEQRPQRVEHELGEHGDAEQRGAGLQESLAPPGDGEHHPGEQQRQRDAQGPAGAGSSAALARRNEGADDLDAARRPRRPRATAGKATQAIGRAMPAPRGDIPERFRKSQHRTISIVIDCANCTRGSCVWPTRFGSIERTSSRPLARTLEAQAVDRPRHRVSARAHVLSEAVPDAVRGRRRSLVRRHAAHREPGAAGARAHRAALAQGHPRGAPGSRGVLSQRQARDLAGLRHAGGGGLHRTEAADRLRRSGQDPAGRVARQGPDAHRLVEAPADARRSSITRRTT